MSKELQTLPDVIAIADDFLVAIADQAERRIDAVIKIKKCALKVTNAQDWVDQQGRPYLQVSGAEKIANLFDISWSFLTPEPIYEEEPDGHYTYTYQGRFTLRNRTIEVEGSRSSKDKFFTQYDYPETGPRIEKTLSERDNKRDVKMSAFTNLLGNGITRLLGIRNLTYADLLKFAGIKMDDIDKVEYKAKGAEKKPITPPQPKNTNSSTVNSEATKKAEIFIATVSEINKKSGNKKDGSLWTLYLITAGEEIFSTFSKTCAEEAKKAQESGARVEISYIHSDKGRNLETIKIIETADDIEGCTKDPKSCDHSSFNVEGKVFCGDGSLQCKYKFEMLPI